MLYDPSYGVIYEIGAAASVLRSMQNSAIAGFYTTVLHPMMEDARIMRIRKPANATELKQEPFILG